MTARRSPDNFFVRLHAWLFSLKKILATNTAAIG
jgi:hypothetical protein